ncbi:MAG TPA: L,D-transpeptidase [Caulobacteraceae bacterium]|nr:L,D-transpeptidase [Caulobacteraceae bacterium]
MSRFGDRRAALTALALGLALALPAPMAFAQDKPAPAEQSAAPDAPPAADAVPAFAPAEPQGRPPSGVAARLADWVAATDDNGGRPFMIVDKRGARVFVFDEVGEFFGSAPVLVGLARGDDSAPGIGDLKFSQISDDQRTTPAGRFVASFGPSAGHGTMLWVDFADAISLHPVMSVNAGEHRQARIKSGDPNQHRISYGCINVPKAFYDGVVLPALAGGSAIVYVLPDTKPLDAVFPVFAAALSGKGEPRQQVSIEDPLFTPVPDQP